MRTKPRAPRLAAIAAWINGLGNGYTAEIVRGYCNTDRQIGRLRWPGKGREGNRLVVRAANGDVVIDHNSAETYRVNEEAVEKAERLFGEMPQKEKK